MGGDRGRGYRLSPMLAKIVEYFELPTAGSSAQCVGVYGRMTNQSPRGIAQPKISTDKWLVQEIRVSKWMSREATETVERLQMNIVECRLLTTEHEGAHTLFDTPPAGCEEGKKIEKWCVQ